MRSLFVSFLIPILATGFDVESEATGVLAKRCLGCHNQTAKVAGLSLADRLSALEGKALDENNPAASRLLVRVAAKQMPPGNPLPAAEVATLRNWVEAGAPWSGALNPPRERAGPDWWSLQPLRVPAIPEVADGASHWRDSAIDRFLLARMSEKGLRPAPPADRTTYIRRATFDLLGLPPTPAEIDAFVSDRSPKAFENLIDRLLASSNYGERWGRHWLDVARFGESFGYERNLPRARAWPYRDYVIRSLNADKPFSRMIIEQLAGDQVAPGDPQVEAATGFLVAGIHDDVTSAVPADILNRRFADLDDMVTATGAAFLGLSVNCARCHDHKFDPIEQKDYYRLQSAFAGVEHRERTWAPPESVRAHRAQAAPIEAELAQVNRDLASARAKALPAAQSARPAIEARLLPPPDSRGTEETFAPIEVRFVRLTITRCISGTKAAGGYRILVSGGAPILDEVELWTESRNVAGSATVTASAAKAGATAEVLTDSRFDQAWASAQGNRAQLTFALPRAERLTRIFWSNDRRGQMQQLFQVGVPADYKFEGSLDGVQWSTLATSERRIPTLEEDREKLALVTVMTDAERTQWKDLQAKRASLQAKLQAIPALPTAYLGAFAQPDEAAWLAKGGNPMSRGGTVPPASIAVLGRVLPGFELEENAPEAARRLALARWMADDRNALVTRVLANRVWQYHFGTGLVNTPNDFGKNGEIPSHPELLDWLAGRLVAHGWRLKPLHREIMLSAAYRQAGTYDEAAARQDRDARLLWRFPPRRLEAEAVRDAVLAVSGALDRTMGGPGFDLFNVRVLNVAAYDQRDSFGPETFRRTVYSRSIRGVKDGLMSSLDCPDSTMSEPKRSASTTPLQLLSLLNSPFMLDQAERFAQRLRREAAGGPAEQVRMAFRLALGRVAQPAEVEEGVRFVRDHGLAALARALFATNEFVFVM
jgi:hypothetical protein